MIRKYSGDDLAKVLIHYKQIIYPETSIFNIVCPFHDDVNPSMRIDLQEGTYFCFGCLKSGNAYDFVRDAEPELSELQACIKLERIVHSKQYEDIKTRFRRKTKKDSVSSINEAKDHYYGLSSVDWNVIKSEEQQKVLSYMQSRGFDARALNVAQCKLDYNLAYPFLFPILDNGEFKGWVARTMNKLVEKKRSKYLYNTGFRKRETLCGHYEQNCVPIVCEGFMDYLAIRTRGKQKNIVAFLGWHMSDEQYKKLKQKGVKIVISFLDNDECGDKGTKYLEKFFHVVRVPYPKGIKDAGDMTPKQIKRMIIRAKKEAKKIEIALSGET